MVSRGATKPRVLFDQQTFLVQKHGGISRYFVELKAELDQLPEIDATIGCLFSHNEYLLNAGLAKGMFRGAAKINKLFYWISRSSCNIIHSTYYFPSMLKYIGGRKHVITVYDMIPERFPECFPQGNPHLAKKEYCSEADLIICISDTTRSDLLSYYNIDPAKAVTIYLGVRVAANVVLNCPKPTVPRYILFVGQRVGYKNFCILLEAFRLIAQADRSLQMMLVGGGEITDDERRQLARLRISNRVHAMPACEDQLRSIYRDAACFVFPSMYEGFGLPVLEAFAEGCPVVLADNPCFREIAQDGAYFFDWRDPEACAHAISEALASGPDRESKIARGFELATTYSWQKTASRHAEAYLRLLAS